MSETTSEKRILSKEEVTRTVKSKNPVRTYAMIEWKKLYRTPAWFMNCVLMPLIWPVFMLGIALISIISSLGMAKTTGLWTRLVADGTIFRLLKGELPVAVAVLTAAGIAVDLGIHEHSVDTYRKRAYFRLGLATRHELLRRYLSLGSLPGPAVAPPGFAAADGRKERVAVFPGSDCGKRA